jgi:hypothetical protein
VVGSGISSFDIDIEVTADSADLYVILGVLDTLGIEYPSTQDITRTNVILNPRKIEPLHIDVIMVISIYVYLLSKSFNTKPLKQKQSVLLEMKTEIIEC